MFINKIHTSSLILLYVIICTLYHQYTAQHIKRSHSISHKTINQEEYYYKPSILRRKTGYRGFGNIQNRMDLSRARELLYSGMCEHVYLDIGTNIGIQIRKLYEPHHYRNAKLVPFFQKTFGCGEKCHRVCTFGFEANPKWTERLKEIESAYKSAFFPLVIFTETAISNYTGNITFFMDTAAAEKYHEWGSSTLAWQKEMKESTAQQVTVGALDIATFLAREVYVRPGQTKNSKVVMKLDVEGSEWFLVPHLLRHDLLCGIDNIFLELHQWIVKGVPKVKEFEASLKWIFKATPGCRTEVMNFDDESYGSGDDKNPLP